MGDFEKIKPIQILIISFVISLIGSFLTNFGKIPSYNQNAGVGGTVFTIGVLVIPIFVKEQRKFAWSKKALIILTISLIINLPFAVITIINHYSI